jgi:hypothetical protein
VLRCVFKGKAEIEKTAKFYKLSGPSVNLFVLTGFIEVAARCSGLQLNVQLGITMQILIVIMAVVIQRPSRNSQNISTIRYG